MKQLPPNNDKFYIDYDKKSDIFRAKEEDVELLGKNILHSWRRVTHRNKNKSDVVFLGKKTLLHY